MEIRKDDSSDSEQQEVNSVEAIPSSEERSGIMPPSELIAHPRQEHHQSFWLWVMCLTGVDYFSTLGYQPSLAYEAAGRLAPIATLLLIAVTLGCALPVYRFVATKSPHGQGSIAMLEKLASGWGSKIIVLVLLGFAATDFIITKTLSAADAAAHLVHNPYWQDLPSVFQGQMTLTMGLLVLLGGMFLRGFREVIGIAVFLVGMYLLLNLIVIGSGLYFIADHGTLFGDWWSQVLTGDWEIPNPPVGGNGLFPILATCLILFPKLALGLSGFETGVVVMPLVRGDIDDNLDQPLGRIRNTQRLLLTSATIMSILLFGSSLVVSTLIKESELRGGAAADRALAFLAHGESHFTISPIFGENFGAFYDLFTVLILWFAGASAMSGLLNIIPRYLPRYGMAPQWAEATRPLVVLLTFVSLLVTWIFDASVEAQGEAYATGVMVLMSSAAIAVVIDIWQESRALGSPRIAWGYVVATLVFCYTTIAIMFEKPDGTQIAGVFILSVIVASAISRIKRSTELRFDRFEFADEESRVLWETLKYLDFPVLVPHRPGRHSLEQKERSIRQTHRLGEEIPIVFIETFLGDTSEFTQSPTISVLEESGRFVVELTKCVSIAHAIALVSLELAQSGKVPEIHFGWSERSPLTASLDFVLFGEGNIPWLVRELIRRAEPDPEKRPRVLIG
ncbi:hypothetical protein [Bythopirellula polymerisocia]|uniref:Amino acid transporter n=1 Tax=Bythopirellula polymerisocia TaxID=2528003 RepID=A0A5C6CVH7_9BACT|nr:hypothetical protein [Bythopirellula polymerisocia]TWU27451.1 hypothetical protein Pla144_22240 [Bythopirellula polymerisocia]